MEFAAAALTSLSGGAGAATAAGIGSDAVAGAAAGAATAGSSLLTPSLFGSILQGGAGLMSAMAAVRQGTAQKEADLQSANQAEMDAAQQQIVGATQTNSLKSQLVATLGQRDVAYGSSGVDLSFGTPAVARSAAIEDAGSAVATTDANTDAQSDRLRQRAAVYRQMAGQAKDAGDVTATGELISAGSKILLRG